MSYKISPPPLCVQKKANKKIRSKEGTFSAPKNGNF
jgi:hypothetical protein